LRTHELREEVRVPITHKGLLGAPTASKPCLIQDFSSKGFLIMSTVKTQLGDKLELKCELYPERFLLCKVEVRHIKDDCLGTKIVEVSDAGLMLCRQFIDEHVSLKRFR
jgi:hypothetical protein